MKNISYNKKRTAVWITIIIIFSLGAAYTFVYIPKNEKNVQAQRFRTLQNIDINIHHKIENSVALMEGLLKEYKEKNDSIPKYIKNYNIYNTGFKLSVPFKTTNKTFKKDTTYSVQISILKSTLNVVGNYNRTEKIKKIDSAVLYEMSTQFTIEEFIKSLLPLNVFDQYILFYNGRVLYEDFPSGIGFLADSLSDKNTGNISSSIKTFNVSGQEYKLFLQPVSINADKQLVVAGLLSGKKYQQEIRQLPYNGILLLLTIVLIAIVTYPWIKLYQMGNTDRLTSSDGIKITIVSMLLMSLFFFTFIKYNTVFKHDNGADANGKISRQITLAFKNEIDTVFEKISLLDSFKTKNQLNNDNIVLIENVDKIALGDSNNKKFVKAGSLKRVSDILDNISVNQVLWLNENGTEIINWTKESMNAPHGEFKTRDYFKNIINNTTYFLNNNPDKKYYLDQVISYTSGAFASVMAMRSIDNKQVVALSFNLQSLKNTVLPLGFQFAIIDNKGKVLYHSDATKNLNENLLDEFSEKDKLRSCIEGRVSDVFTTKYFSRSYNLSVTPINELPYFIVIFNDTSFKETRDVEIYSFTFSMMFLIFIYFLLQLGVTIFVSSKKSIFKKQRFDIHWIGPKILAVKQYYLATFFNVLVLITAIVFYSFSSVLTYFFLLLFSITFTAIFLNAIFAKYYWVNKQPEHRRYKLITICWLCIFIIIINSAAIKILEGDNMLVLCLYEIMITAFGYLCYTFGKKLVTECNKYLGIKFKIRADFAAGFTAMVFTKLLLTSGLPVLFFYITSYNYEQNISTRYRQLQYAHELPDMLNYDQLRQMKTSNYLCSNDQSNGTNNKYFYLDSACINSIAFNDNISVQKYTTEDEITTHLLRLFRINISSDAINENKFYTYSASDSSFFFNHLLNKVCRGDSISNISIRNPEREKNIVISSVNLNYVLPSFSDKDQFNGAIFWLLLVVALLFFYFILYKILKKLFCLSLPDLELWKKIDHKILRDTVANNLLFVIGLPGSGKLSRILKTIKNNEFGNGNIPLIYDKADEEKSNVIIVDLINIPDAGEDREKDEHWQNLKLKALSPKYKLMVINHFEYNIQDAATSSIKLNFLEQIMVNYTSKVIILSTIHPVAFLDSILSNTNKQQPAVPGQDLERWHVLLGHFRIIVYPLEECSLQNMNDKNKAIFNETMYTHFLRRVQNSATDAASKLSPYNITQQEEGIIFKLQVTGHYFYMYIWQSLTKEEKFLLYDLAEDSLVNSFDEYNLNMLRAKGVIISVNGTLKLFNKGFRNFILTAIGNTEAMKIKSQIEDNGNWSQLKSPLLIIIGAIIIFLIASQEEAYSKMLTYVAALGAGIPTVIKLFSLFDKGAAK